MAASRGVGLIRRFALAMVAGAVLVMGLWVRPAFAASAPFCDERAATALAPPPAPSPPGETIARAACHTNPFAALATRLAGLTPGHPSPEAPVATVDAALPASVVHILPPDSIRAETSPAEEFPAAGVRSRIERPPRG